MHRWNEVIASLLIPSAGALLCKSQPIGSLAALRSSLPVTINLFEEPDGLGSCRPKNRNFAYSRDVLKHFKSVAAPEELRVLLIALKGKLISRRGSTVYTKSILCDIVINQNKAVRIPE